MITLKSYYIGKAFMGSPSLGLSSWMKRNIEKVCTTKIVTPNSVLQ